MAKDERDVLEVLRAELDFIEKGGYGRSVRTPWKPTKIFMDSPSCINLGDSERAEPCEDCPMMEFVPPQSRLQPVPCHSIPLDEQGSTVESLMARGNQEELEDAVKNWLGAAIRRIEEARAGPHPVQPAGKAAWWKLSPAPAARQRVLVVDDDEGVLIRLQKRLENEGYDITTAWSGREGLRLLRSGRFDIVLLDDYLPDVTSEEILRQLQQISAHTPVLLMQTATLTDDAAARYARLGAHYFVSKRQPDCVSALVRDCLNRGKTLPSCA